MYSVPVEAGITPDKWVILIITLKDGEVLRKVLGSWGGGYLNGDSWRVSSCINKVISHPDHYEVQTETGSSYLCRFGSTGMNTVAAGVVERLKDHPKVENVEVSFDV